MTRTGVPFVVTSGRARPPFEPAEAAFNRMARPVRLRIAGGWGFRHREHAGMTDGMSRCVHPARKEAPS